MSLRTMKNLAFYLLISILQSDDSFVKLLIYWQRLSKVNVKQIMVSASLYRIMKNQATHGLQH